MVFLRHHPARLRVLARRRNRQLALALQELQRVAGFLRARFFHDGEDLVPQIRLAEIKQRLAGEGRVFDSLLRRH